MNSLGQLVSATLAAAFLYATPALAAEKQDEFSLLREALLTEGRQDFARQRSFQLQRHKTEANSRFFSDNAEQLLDEILRINKKTRINEEDVTKHPSLMSKYFGAIADMRQEDRRISEIRKREWEIEKRLYSLEWSYDLLLTADRNDNRKFEKEEWGTLLSLLGLPSNAGWTAVRDKLIGQIREERKEDVLAQIR